MLVARRKLLLHFATFSFGEEGYILNLSATKVNAHHKTAAGKKHQKGEGTDTMERNAFIYTSNVTDFSDCGFILY